jgi:uncharacterized membrane protein YgdD (TMEM256/DUF423 family)
MQFFSMVESWRVAVLYQLLHASALVGISALCDARAKNEAEGSSSFGGSSNLRRVGELLALGTTMFSGSIYCLCFGIGPKKILGPTTPLGGLIMISGWTMLAFC